MNERRFVLHNDFIRKNVLSFMEKLDLAKPVEVIVRPYVEKRTLEQNDRLWALHRKAAEYTGHSAEEMHEFALMRYFGMKEIKVGGMIRMVPLKRSSMRNRKEFADFMEATEAWYISEFGVWLDQLEAA